MRENIIISLQGERPGCCLSEQSVVYGIGDQWDEKGLQEKNKMDRVSFADGLDNEGEAKPTAQQHDIQGEKKRMPPPM